MGYPLNTVQLEIGQSYLVHLHCIYKTPENDNLKLPSDKLYITNQMTVTYNKFHLKLIICLTLVFVTTINID